MITADMLAEKIYKEIQQDNQNVKFDFQEVEVKFFGFKDGYTTEMFAGYYRSSPISWWNIAVWRKFAIAALQYYAKRSPKAGREGIESIVLTVPKPDPIEDLQFCILL